MQTILRLFLSLPLLLGLAFSSNAVTTPPKKFSRTGNTAEVANLIHSSVKSDLFRIEARDPYPSDYEATEARAKWEQQDHALTSKLDHIASYDRIFIGYPIWWGELPPPVVSFLTTYNLAGKTIVPFSTHGGSGLGRTVDEIATLCPSCAMAEGLAIEGSDSRSAQALVTDWLRHLGLISTSSK